MSWDFQRLVDHLHQLGPHGTRDDGVLALRQGGLEDVPGMMKIWWLVNQATAMVNKNQVLPEKMVLRCFEYFKSHSTQTTAFSFRYSRTWDMRVALVTQAENEQLQ